MGNRVVTKEVLPEFMKAVEPVIGKEMIPNLQKYLEAKVEVSERCRWLDMLHDSITFSDGFCEGVEALGRAVERSTARPFRGKSK